MAGNLPALPEGWDEGIPAAAWPQALIDAVQRDARALGSPRAIRTVREWQVAARNSANPAGQPEARQRLLAIGAALLSADPDQTDLLSGEISLPELRPSSLRESAETEFTQDTFQMPPKPNLRRAADGLSTLDEDTDSKLRSVASTPSPAPDFSEDDDRPTFAFTRPELDLAKPSAPQPPLPPPLPLSSTGEAKRRRTGVEEAAKAPSARVSAPVPVASNEDDGGPTRHIEIPEDLLRKPAPSIDDEDETHALTADETPPGMSRPKLMPVAGDDRTDPPSQRLAPKPGIINRRAARRSGHSSARPRASMQHVRPLYAILRPFVDELLPLPVERRSRRFWARWREVAGDRGVRREVIEELLTAAEDVRTLLCELIAEVESADPKSVYALVDRIVATGGVELARAQLEPVPDRHRGQLVGAPVALEDESQDPE